MKIEFNDIVWDTEGENVTLPQSCIIEIENDVDPAYEGADLLSDMYSWCVISFNYTIL